MRQKLDVVELRSMPDGYEFCWSSRKYQLWFEDGAWRLMRLGMADASSLFGSFNEAMNHALDDDSWNT